MTPEYILIAKYKRRLKTVFSNPNPYTKPLWEKSEIEQKIKELEKINKEDVGLGVAII